MANGNYASKADERSKFLAKKFDHFFKGSDSDLVKIMVLHPVWFGAEW